MNQPGRHVPAEQLDIVNKCKLARHRLHSLLYCTMLPLHFQKRRLSASLVFVCCITGLAWAVWFESIQSGIAAKEPEFAAKLHGYQQHSKSAVQAGASEEQTVPWRGFLRNRPVQALAYAHFCNNWWVLCYSFTQQPFKAISAE